MTSEDSALVERFGAVRQKVHAAAAKSGRPVEKIGLIAVSKKQPIEKMRAYQSWCLEQRSEAIFGENYVQEFKEKRAQLAGAFAAHLIGPLQSNKAAAAVELFEVIESIHSDTALLAVAKAAAKQEKIQDIFLQVNISEDALKSGFSSNQIALMLDLALKLGHVRVCGLMTITREYEHRDDVRPDFQKMRLLRERLGMPNLLLSMGMSSDFDIAIEEGADLVRVEDDVGTALFGSRG
jgi:pyridoxal phosphate enzyme (YggS family)